MTGKLSLVNVPGFPRVTAGSQGGEVAARPDSAPPVPPIESYAGLEAATAARIAKFEAETRAMLTQRGGARGETQSSLDISAALEAGVGGSLQGQYYTTVL